jgi:phosphatidylinositol alpha-1,6-mannosyltransferase
LNKKILFLTLKVFSATGGIEKVCRVQAKAIYESLQEGQSVQLLSMHDQPGDAKGNPYLPEQFCKSWAGKKLAFMSGSFKAGKHADIVLLSHINLLPAGWLIKLRNPSAKLILICHGIEVWKPLGKITRKMLAACNRFICVSNFTKNKMQAMNGIPSEKTELLNNCLDPFLAQPVKRGNRSMMLDKYGFDSNDVILLMLSRIASTERHKNYDHVIAAMPQVTATTGKQVRYLIAGKYTEDEAAHIMQEAKKYGVENNVKLAGFVQDEDLPEYFAQADLYVMPSTKEGFGIVFIEAMYYGLPVIAGNKDGSVDALANGKLGLLIDPEDTDAIATAIEKILQDKTAFIPNREILMEHFGFDNYKKKLHHFLNDWN